MTSIASHPTGSLAGRARMLDRHAALDARADEIGGKAASLVALTREGFPVPAFACVTTAVFDDLVAALPDDLLRELDRPPRDPAELERLSRRAIACAREVGLQPADRTALGELLAEAFEAGASFAVRSSAVGEDSTRHSFAGQLGTALCVELDDVAARVLDCCLSPFSAHALAYRRCRGLGRDAARMGVAIQLMVDSAVAGVAFTADPLDGSSERMLVTAGLGLGEGVVEGRVDVDSYTLDPDGTVIDRVVVAKRTRVVRDRAGGGTRIEPVTGGHAERPALTDEQLAEIARHASALAAARGRPQDVEWALDDTGRLLLLQARPITTTATGRRSVFDNSNLVESFPGLTSPLTFSLMRRAYQLNFLGLVRAFGAPDAMVEANRDAYANLVALLHGRMYYNLSNWYRMFLQLPGMERAVPAFESAMGFESGDVRARRLSLVGRLRWLPLQTLVAVRLLVAWRTIPRRVEDFRTAVDEARTELRGQELDSLDAHALVDRVEEASERIFRAMSVAPISDFFTQQTYGLLGRAIESWELGDPVPLRNELLCGETGMESVEPVRSLVGIAERVRSDAGARALLDSERPPSHVWRDLATDPAHAWLRAELQIHLDRYGDRSLGELKLETRTLVDEPGALVAMLRNYVRGGQDVASMERHEQRIRQAAERRVRRALWRHPIRAGLFAFVLSECRSGLKTRENVRLARGRLAGLFRELYRTLGDRFVEARLLDDREDVFLLTTDEVADAVRGAAVTRDLRALVALRRSEHAAAHDEALSRVECRGIALATPLEPPPAEPAVSGGVLRGTGCSPGRVRAEAMVIETPRADAAIAGEILVATTTDPGWVFLMVAAGGLVTEKGNVLSHTAIIGRELGIPTVVGVAGAMRAIAHGAPVDLDGRLGTVTILQETEAEPR